MSPHPTVVWAHPDSRLWVAVGATAAGQSHAGVVELVAGSFVAFDGRGVRLGSFDRRSDAESAVRSAWLGEAVRPTLTRPGAVSVPV